jgi:RND family efflux transporter MFP subunit
MHKSLVFVVVASLAATAACKGGDDAQGGAAAATAGGGGQAGAGRAGARGARPPMPVEFAVAKRAPVSEQMLIVGNLIGAATVQVVPRVNGRLASVAVKLGDSVRRGQMIAKVEDMEIQEQVRQAEAALQVSKATIGQRNADLKLATTNRDRSKSLYDRQLLPQQTYDDTEARYQAAMAQTDLAQAQFDQATARLEELKITLANTIIASPVDGFVGKRFLDPGASVGPNSPVASVVDIRTVRMVANLVERDSKRVPPGTNAAVEVDAFPGEKFQGRVSRVAPVFDPATRTAEMEIEIPNSNYRLKPGMYARVQLTVDSNANALTVPRNALVEIDGKPGVFIASSGGGGGRGGGQGGGQASAAKAEGQGTAGQKPAESQGQQGPSAMTAKFLPVQTGIRDGEHIEITSGLQDGTRVITTGAGALKDGDRIVAATPADGRGRGREGRGGEGGERANREGPGPRQGSDR